MIPTTGFPSEPVPDKTQGVERQLLLPEGAAMIRSLMLRTAGFRSLAVATLILVMTAAGSPAVRDAAARSDGPRAVFTSESARFRSGDWISLSRDTRGDKVFQVELDGLLGDMGRRGSLILDRDGLMQALQAALGPEANLEQMRVIDLLRGVRRVEVRFEGMSIPLGPRQLRRLLTHFASGADWPIQEMPLSALIEQVSGVEVNAFGAQGWLDDPTIVALLGRSIGKAQRADRTRDADFERRVAYQARYRRVLEAVHRAERDVAGTKDASDRLYDAAYDNLEPAAQQELAPLLDLYVQLDRELERTYSRSMTRAERIAQRIETRRQVFGDDLTNVLFKRDEAMERYELDRLALQADTSLSARARAAKLDERRTALAVELAQQGIYVSFPDAADAAARRTR
jgi:hypothetical protein